MRYVTTKGYNLTKPKIDRRTHQNKVKNMAQMALATKKTETHKHKVEHMVHSTWQLRASVAEHVSDNIDQTRAVHMLGKCFSHEYRGFGEGCV